MNSQLKTVIATILGIAIGGAVNMGIITIGPMVIPPPAGSDLSTMEGLKAAMPLMQPKHFITPFAAHAAGTFVAAAIIAAFAPLRTFYLAMLAGVLFLIGGIMAVQMLPEAPVWFNVLDLSLAYIPAAFLGYRLFKKNKA